MERSKLVLFVLMATLCLVGPLPTVHATISRTGSINPSSNPTGWGSGTTVEVGYTDTGAVTVKPTSTSSHERLLHRVRFRP